MRLRQSIIGGVAAALVASAGQACTGFDSSSEAAPNDGGSETSVVDASDTADRDSSPAAPTDAGADARGPLRVFVTSGTFVGSSFGTGALLADVKCSEEAGGGTWRAFLKAGTQTPGERMQAAGPWVHPKTGNVVFVNAAALDAPGTLATISWGFDGNALEAGSTVDVWTGAYDLTCGDWADPNAQGGVGRFDATNANWRTNDSRSCNTPVVARLYCLEQ